MRSKIALLGCMVSLAFIPRVYAENILEIYQDAVENDLVMRAAKAQLKAGLEAKDQALAAYLPQIGATANYGQNKSKSESSGFPDGSINPSTFNSSSTTGGQWSLSLGQQILNMATWYSLQGSDHQTKQAEYEFFKTQQTLIVRTVEAYLGVLRAHNNLESSQAEERAVKQQLDQTQQRFNVGLVAITDVHEAKAAFDLAKVTRLNDQGALETSYEALTVLTGRFYDAVQPLSDNLPISLPTPEDRKAWTDLAMKGNPDLLIARENTESSKYSAKAARAARYPTVSLAANYGRGYTEGEQFQTENIKTSNQTDSIALQLTIPLWQGGALDSRARQASFRFEQARENMGSQQRQVVQQVRSSHIDVLTSIQQVSARKLSIVSAQSALDATQAGYNYGTRNIVDVLNAQRTLYQAQRDYGNSRYDYINDLLRLKQSAGVLTPQDILALNQWIEQKKQAVRNPGSMAAY